MKNILALSLLVLLSTRVHSQEVVFPRNAEGRIEFTEVVSVDSASPSALYSRSKLFVAHAFNSAPDVTKLDDPATSTLITKGLLPRNYTNPFNRAHGGNVQFTLTIQCKDGRYKYTLTDLVHIDNVSVGGGPLENDSPTSKMYITKKAWAKIKQETSTRISALIDELKKTMTQSSGNDNW